LGTPSCYRSIPTSKFVANASAWNPRLAGTGKPPIAQQIVNGASRLDKK
jgi:hypothetical protein